MASEYDLLHHPQLNPIVQQKIAMTILRVSRICWKLCYKESGIEEECIRNCTENYIAAFDLALKEIKNMQNNKKSSS
jgi:hypothetical protein